MAAALGELGAVLQAMGRPEEARPPLERALGILEMAHGRSHPDTRAAWGRLARLHGVASLLLTPEALQARCIDG